MKPYAWLIHRDHVDQGMAENLLGPTGSDATVAQVIDAGVGFRLLTEDGQVAYEGLFEGPDHSRVKPLLEFGAWAADCTTIQYRNARGAWEAVE